MSSSDGAPAQDLYGYAWNLYIASQSFNATDVYGNQTTVSFQDINSYEWGVIAQSSTFGFTVGFTSMLMIVLLILTERKKALRPIFIFNFASLFLICFREILFLAQNGTGYTYGIGEVFLGAQYHYSKTGADVLNILGYIINMVLYPCFLISLVLQVRVVFAAEPRTQMLITVILGLGALTIEVFWITFNAYVMKFILSDPIGLQTIKPFIYNTVQIGVIIFVGICCLLFLFKLFVTIRRRRKMGFQRFGPLHILFIMFSQCLILPLIVYIVYFSTPNSPFQNVTGIGETLLICSLPLSALWASHEAESHTARTRINTTSSSMTADSSPSSRFRNRFRIFRGTKDMHSSTHSDLEKGSNYSELESKKGGSIDGHNISPSFLHDSETTQ